MAADPVMRQQIGQMILNITAGANTETSILAQADALASTIGGMLHLAGRSRNEALAVADECAESIRTHIRKNWGGIQIKEADNV